MKVMRRYNGLTIWFAAFLLVFSAGCSDYDTAGTNQTVTPPTAISVTPLSAASACSTTLVTATFSKAMNLATINGTTFTLTGPGAAAVSGVVTYDAPGDTATFTPTATLALGTAYTATITTGATEITVGGPHAVVLLVKLQTKLLANASPNVSWAPVVIVAV